MAEAPDVEDIEDVDPGEFADLPRTDVEVECHVHFGMTGSFPLRLAELFFADDGLYIAEYAYITPMFGLATRKHRRESRGMAAIYAIHGLDEVLLQADGVVWHGYGNVDRVLLYDGGPLGRPKVAVHPEHGSVQAYRLHEDDPDVEALTTTLRTIGEERGFAVTHRKGVGFSPRATVARFLGRD